MAGNSAIIKVDIIGDATKAERASERANRAFGGVGRGADQMGRKTQGAERKTSRMGVALGGASKAAGALGVALGAAQVLKFGADSLRAASDVQQSFGALDAVFGRNAGQMKKWARGAADSLGLASSEYANLAVVTGAMLKNNGIKDFAGETDRLIKLGADLAAQFGGSTKDAVEAIGSLMRGEADPIERYGVSIKQSAISADLAARGLGKLEGKAKTQAEQQSRLRLLFEQTGTAQGAFARESGTLAQEQQKLSAKFENLKATLGEKLLPVASRVTSWLSKTIDGSNTTGKTIRRMADIYMSYVKPAWEGFRKGLDRVNTALGGTKGKTDGLERASGKLLDVLELLAPFAGKSMGRAWEVLGTSLSISAGGARELARGAQWAAEQAASLYSWLGRLRERAGVLGDIASGLGAVPGLLRSAPLPDMSGLGRAGGGGLVGAGGGGTTVRVTSSPRVSVFIDGRALDSRMVRIAREQNTSTAIDYRRRS